jgi:hypothetical protein
VRNSCVHRLFRRRPLLILNHMGPKCFNSVQNSNISAGWESLVRSFFCQMQFQIAHHPLQVFNFIILNLEYHLNSPNFS